MWRVLYFGGPWRRDLDRGWVAVLGGPVDFLAPWGHCVCSPGGPLGTPPPPVTQALKVSCICTPPPLLRPPLPAIISHNSLRGCVKSILFEIRGCVRGNCCFPWLVNFLAFFLAAWSKAFRKASLSLMKEQVSQLAKSASSNILSYFVSFWLQGWNTDLGPETERFGYCELFSAGRWRVSGHQK